MLTFRQFNGSAAAIYGWQVDHNRVEDILGSVLDIALEVQPSVNPLILGPNDYIGPLGAMISNSTPATRVDIKDRYIAQVSLTAGLMGAGTTVALGTVGVPNTTTGPSMLCAATMVGDNLGIVPSCYVSVAGTVAIRLTNATGGSITLGAKTYRVDVTPAF
jgi:hypothetical protein